MKKNIVFLMLVLGLFSLQAQQKNIVLELFTSQGCSSCPSADKLLKQISENHQYKNIMVLSYHVDYWNRLGWVDPFSKESYTNYQKQYGLKFKQNSIYTPELVINGNQHIVGSDINALQKSINKLNNSKLPVTIKVSELQKEKGKLVSNYNIKGLNYNKVSFVLVLKEQITNVKRGENSNRTLINTNVVLDKKIIDKTTDNQKGKIIFNIPKGYDLNEVKVIAYSQTKGLTITGATEL